MRSLEDQIRRAKRDYPYLEHKSNYKFRIVFPEYPDLEYQIQLPSDYPDSAPTILQNDNEIQFSILTYWTNTFTITNLIQNLYLYVMRNNGPSMIPQSPPVRKTLSPIISPRKRNLQSNSFSLKTPIIKSNQESTTKTNTDDSSDSPLNEAERREEEIRQILTQKTGNEYEDALNTLKLKFKNKEINTDQFTTEFQKIQVLRSNE